MSTVHLLVPLDLDDPRRVSGGNVYDRRVRDGLAASGWQVRQVEVGPTAGALAAALAGLPDDAVVVVDGLVASGAADEAVRHAGRLRLVPLVHLPLGVDDAAVHVREAALLDAARAVVVSSGWTRRWLVGHYGLAPGRVEVAEPGVEPEEVAPASTSGGRLLCVSALTPGKAHAVLLTALSGLRDLTWTCTCVGGTDRDPEHARRVLSAASDLRGRVRFTDALTGAELGASYASADLLVHPSRFETYGMVVTEALAHGLPVLTTSAGGLPETLGRLPDGTRPGLLVPPEDPGALADALRRWLTDADLRSDLRSAAQLRRGGLRGWDRTVHVVARVLEEVAA